MLPDDNNGGWGNGPDSFPAKNTLYIYRPGDIREESFAERSGKTHEGRLFIHDKCTGNRASYTAAHVNELLTAPDNPEQIKERIVELIPRLSPDQMRWLATDISKDALKTIQSIQPQVAETLSQLKDIKPAHFL